MKGVSKEWEVVEEGTLLLWRKSFKLKGNGKEGEGATIPTSIATTCIYIYIRMNGRRSYTGKFSGRRY